MRKPAKITAKRKPTKKPSSKPKTMGMLFVRNMGAVHMVFGIIPNDLLPQLKSEHQYVVEVRQPWSVDGTGVGNVSPDPSLTILQGSSIDRTKEAIGMTADQLLTSQIWRIG